MQECIEAENLVDAGMNDMVYQLAGQCIHNGGVKDPTDYHRSNLIVTLLVSLHGSRKLQKSRSKLIQDFLEMDFLQARKTKEDCWS